MMQQYSKFQNAFSLYAANYKNYKNQFFYHCVMWNSSLLISIKLDFSKLSWFIVRKILKQKFIISLPKNYCKLHNLSSKLMNYNI